MQEEQRWSGALVMQTVVATVLALIVFIIVSMIASTLIFLLNATMTILREGIIAAMSGAIGAFLGVGFAKAACDAVLKAYSAKSVFIGFALALVYSTYSSLVLAGPWDSDTLIRSIIDVATITAAYWTFWLGETLN